MKKIFTIIGLLVSLSMSAVTVNDVAGTFKGNLNVGGQKYANRQIYILPGTEASTITFVLPDFAYNGAPLGDIVLANIPMDGNGRLTLEGRTLYIKAIKERATIDVVNGLQDGGVTYNSDISASQAMVLLSIAAPSLPKSIFVLFTGTKVTDENYDVTNGGFEGNWSNGEVSGWHSFNTATGGMASFIKNKEQFTKSTEIRPGSTGSQSALLKTKDVLDNNANGNCTNGQINAGSTSATDASGNYNFSAPSNSGYNTPFVGNPDSLVFWVKYIPADKNPSNSANKARAHAVVTTDARYQDPEAEDYSAVKIADAEVNYSATADLGWQRLAVPFKYTSVDPSTAAYMLITFTTNMTPGGGSAYTEGGGLFGGGTFYPDNVYLDDVEMIYNHSLISCTVDGQSVAFANGRASSELVYSDSEYEMEVVADGKAAKSFVAYDEANYQVHVYVVADNYSQAGAHTIYTLQMAEPIYDTEYTYEATTCQGEPYTDELFEGLTESGEYKTVIPNTQGGDSIITLTLTVLPTYEIEESRRVYQADVTWHGKQIKDLEPSDEPYIYYDSLTSVAGCDSVHVLKLYVSSVPITYGQYEVMLCEGEEEEFAGTIYDKSFEGDILLDEKNVYGGDSIVHLIIRVMPNYTVDQYLTIFVGDDAEWEGWNLSTLPEGKMELYAQYYTINDCDSTLVLHLTVNPVPLETGIADTQRKQTQKIYKQLMNGQLFIIKEDETIYDILGNKIK